MQEKRRSGGGRTAGREGLRGVGSKDRDSSGDLHLVVVGDGASCAGGRVRWAEAERAFDRGGFRLSLLLIPSDAESLVCCGNVP